MNLAVQLHHRQAQSLAITPQLIQSVQLLQYSGEELEDFLREQVEKNPLIDVIGGSRSSSAIGEGCDERNGPSENLKAKQASVDISHLSHPQEVRSAGPEHLPLRSAMGRLDSRVSSTADDLQNLENYCASSISLKEHLRSQLAMAVRNKPDLSIAWEIVDSLEPDGYLRRDLSEIAETLGVDRPKVAAILDIVQTLEPTGVGARNLSECLRLQLREQDRLDPAMSAFLENLPLLADYRIPALAKICGVDREDILDMAKEIRELDPRPGSRFDCDPVLPALPDILVHMRQDGTLIVDLNSELLPKILVDRKYFAEITANCLSKNDRTFVVDCWKSANWLARNLDQRAQTILKVATEIVAQQRKFFVEGVERLRPLTLKDVAQAVGLHESTVSRATSNKYMTTNRGTFELKFFFTNPIASSDGGADYSAEAIRHKLKSLMDTETADSVLSDDAIVIELRRSGVDIARRTITKYRDAMNIGSSLQRRRQKLAQETV
jgi:RNA polymerase sigma-54 factor